MPDNILQIYRSIFTGEQIDEILSRLQVGGEVDVKLAMAVIGERLTLAEYRAKLSAGQIVDGNFYRIYSDAEKTVLAAIYDGKNLFFSPSEFSDRFIVGESLTQAEYNYKLSRGEIQNGYIYRIYGDQRKEYLQAIYDGTTLVARRNDSGARGFPYDFPIIFG